jgi:hypothetical protein
VGGRNIDHALYKLGATFINERAYFNGQEAMADLQEMASTHKEQKVFVNFSECTISHGDFLSNRLETATETMMEHLRNLLDIEGVDLKSLNNVGLELHNSNTEGMIFICADDNSGHSHRVEIRAT